MEHRIFVIGATGFVGGTLADHFVAQGHQVRGLARSEAAAAALKAGGIQPVRGDLEADLASVVAGLDAADTVIYAAQVAFNREPAIVGALIAALEGSGKTFVLLSGTGVFMQRTAGAWSADSFAEDDAFEPEPLAASRVEAENLVRVAAARGVRSMVIRPPLIWGPGDNGPVASAYRSVALTGSACYVGAGLAAYSNVHAADLARLFSLVVARGQPGALYHAVAGEIPYRWIADAVARDLGVDTRSLTIDEAAEVFGPFGALIQSSCSRSRDPRTRAELDWTPVHLDLLSKVGEPRLRALANLQPTKENHENA